MAVVGKAAKVLTSARPTLTELVVVLFKRFGSFRSAGSVTLAVLVSVPVAVG